MGSAQELLTLAQAAKILGVTGQQVQNLCRNQQLDAHYPRGKRGGQHFLAEDVYNLQELRALPGLQAKLPHLAMKAIMSSRRVEKQFKELCMYLGLDADVLRLEKEEVVSLYHQAENFLDQLGASEEDILRWARTILSITEEFLLLTEQHLGEDEPWRLYYEVYNKLSASCPPGTRLRIFVDHAKRNLRNVTYFYIRGIYGGRKASRAVPREAYSRRVIQTLFPVQ
jgi:hypothetical protein